MIEKSEIELDKLKLTYLKVSLPKAPLVMVIAAKGYVMCGYLNIGTAEKLGQAAAIVRGVNDAEGILNGKISAATSQASKLGVSDGMLGREALRKFT